MFCNTLITNELSNSYSCEKYLHAYRIIFVHKISFLTKTSIILLQAYNKEKQIICTDNTTIDYNPQIEIVSPAETKQYFNIFILKNEMV